ncbi:restriction endonuclease [Nocardioides pakistanensis]
MKRLSTEAYQALRDALAVMTWFKKPFQSFLRTALRDHPELLAGLDFDGHTKREVADDLVSRLIADEARFQDVTIRLMLEVAALDRFPDIERLEEPDRSLRLGEAKDAVAHMRAMTERFADRIAEQERLEAERASHKAQAVALRQFEDDLADLKARFLELSAATDARQRGYDFEKFLADLFKTFDMEPRLGYSTDLEQIDGSLTFDTDDYIVEAKWISATVSRETADAFAAKVRRKGKNALGLIIAVNGFSGPALRAYEEKTPFLAIDGGDLFLVLDSRVRLDDLLKAKRRHANETGSCHLPASAVVN